MNAVDTNVLIYVRDPRDSVKQQRTVQLMRIRQVPQKSEIVGDIQSTFEAQLVQTLAKTIATQQLSQLSARCCRRLTLLAKLPK